MPRLNYQTNGSFLYCKWGWEFIVQGKGGFPLDMLRYDYCYPMLESEISSLNNFLRDSTVISLKTEKRNITPKRWESFCWKIVQAFPLDRNGFRQDGEGINLTRDYKLKC